MRRTPAQNNVREWRWWLFVAAVVVQLLLASGSITLMSAVRVFVTGESLWSKGMNSAFMHLEHYAATGRESDFQQFTQAIAIPQGASMARQLMDMGSPDIQRVKEGLIQAENHPDDVNSLMRLLPHVWHSEVMASTIAVWRMGDAHLHTMAQLGADIRTRRQSGTPVNARQVALWQEQITDLNRSVTPLAKEFSATLGAKARALGQLLLLINTLTAVLLGLLYWYGLRRAMLASAKVSTELETERLRSGVTLAALGDGVITLDAQRSIRYVNPAAARLLDTEAHLLLHQDITKVLPFAQQVLSSHAEHTTERNGDNARPPEEQVHWISRRLSGEPDVAVRVSVTALTQDERPSGTVLVLHDVSQEQNYMRMLVWQQSHDLLTGLDNRPAFEKYMHQVLGKQQFSLLHLNLDHFKMINASYGHAAGDEILRQVCQQLRLALREQDVLARVGGDEFAVLLVGCHPHAALQTAERLRKSVHDLNVRWHNHNLHTGVSIGVVHILPNQNTDPQILLGMSDSACKHAKESGRNRITVYDPFNQVFQRHQGDMEWVQRLRSSLETNNFTLYAQTVYPLQPQGKGQQGVHFEVLLRLLDVPGKHVSPADFIPIAERYDLMTQIDRWVVRNALKLLKFHLAQGANISTCAINLSGTSLGDGDLLEFIRHHILEYGVAPEKLCFEITETSAIASMDHATSMIEELRKLGCRFSLDDFGSGMASFKYLQQLPVDYLKIDGSFVRDMLRNPSNFAMVEAINHIGHVMGKSTVAEFVGDKATFDALRAMGVDYAQGYYIAAPIPLDKNFFLRASSPPPQLAPTGKFQSPNR